MSAADKRDVFIGADVGTSACKSLAIDGSGAVIARRSVGYPLSTPRLGWAEQNPDDWARAAFEGVAAVAAALPESAQVRAVGLSGQMHGLVALDAENNPLRPAILWNDQRAAPQCEKIVEKAGGLSALLRMTNNRMLPGYTGGKIAWLRDEEPEIFARMTMFLHPKDYLLLRLTGARSTDVSDASGTGLFDVRNRAWHRELFRLLDLPESLAPKCLESREVAGHLTRAAAAQTGLTAGIPVIAGGGDAVIQTAGSGVTDPGVVQTTLGTAGIVACALDSCVDNPEGRLQIFCNNEPGLWHCMGVSLSAGGAFEWLRVFLERAPNGAGRVGFEEMTALAGEAAAGSGGLFFLPYLSGERCPHPNPDARGALIGLTLRHGPAEVIRAVMEGVTFAMRDIAELMRDMGVDAREIRFSGGGAADPLWRRLQADALGGDVVIVEGASEGGAYGAALLAGVGVGHWPTLSAAAKVLREKSRTPPNSKNRAIYDRTFPAYQRLYRSLESDFSRIAGLAPL